MAVAARTWRADLVHGLHVEVPPGRVPSVVTIHDLIPLDVPGSIRNRGRLLLYRRAVAAALARACRLIVPSPATAARLEAEGVDRSRIAVVPLGAGPTFRPLEPDEKERARKALAGGRPYVVGSSGSRPHKNLAALVDAAGRLAPEVVVVATGPAPSPAPPHLAFAGRLDEGALAALYGGAEAMVLPALVEGFGLPALEALACGVPVVCGDGTGAAAFLAEGMLQVDVRRPAALAEAVRALVDDDELRSRLGRAGRKAAAPFTVEAMARATLTVYLDVLSRR